VVGDVDLLAAVALPWREFLLTKVRQELAMKNKILYANYKSAAAHAGTSGIVVVSARLVRSSE
jgi:hypothetical protein